VRAIAAADTHPLRLAVLRPGLPPEEAAFPGDDDPATAHFGAFVGGRLAGIASLYREPRPGGPSGAGGWRIRGMATLPEARGRGLGRALLDACVAHAGAQGGSEVWCNARTVAVEFYAAAGFDVVSEQFDIPGIGPHLVMRRPVTAPAPGRPESVEDAARRLVAKLRRFIATELDGGERELLAALLAPGVAKALGSAEVEGFGIVDWEPESGMAALAAALREAGVRIEGMGGEP
jgi:GNAT superfamily N-acetyltransferase